MVLQDTWLFHGTIKENLMYGKLDASDEEVKNAGETVDELRNIIEGMMDQKMIQMFIDEQKRKLEERDRLLSEKDEEIRQLKARIAQLEGK